MVRGIAVRKSEFGNFQCDVDGHSCFVEGKIFHCPSDPNLYINPVKINTLLAMQEV